MKTIAAATLNFVWTLTICICPQNNLCGAAKIVPHFKTSNISNIGLVTPDQCYNLTRLPTSALSSHCALGTIFAEPRSSFNISTLQIFQTLDLFHFISVIKWHICRPQLSALMPLQQLLPTSFEHRPSASALGTIFAEPRSSFNISTLQIFQTLNLLHFISIMK